MRWAKTTLTGWGRSRHAELLAARPERMREAEGAVAEAGSGSLLAYGGGRSYGDNALNGGGRALMTGRLDRLVSFDPATDVLVCEAGVTLHALNATFLPRRRIVPVSPGTAYATVGGAIANDVHGKNHESAGGFGDHVLWFSLLTPDGRVRRVTHDDDPELFAATVGGCGLTGIILEAAFRLKPVPSSTVAVKERRVPDLDSFIAAFEECRHKTTYSVGWIDGVAKGAALGRGILETAEFADRDAKPWVPPKPKTMPLDLPGFALNPLSVRAFNELYFRRVPEGGREKLTPYTTFLYPLDAILHWNRIYGKRGFYQFQNVVPDAEAPVALRKLMEAISASGLASFLAVLKTLGSAGRGHLSFPMKGYTLALDFPKSAKADELLTRLERITLDHGGRVYLAKDSLLSAGGFAAMYPRLPELRSVLARLDGNGAVRFDSDQARRLGIREAA